MSSLSRAAHSGHKRVLLGAYAWFALWSAVAGFSAFSRSLIFFAVCRALQGIAPAAILVNSVALLGRTYAPGPRKNYAFAIFAASAPNGFLVGGPSRVAHPVRARG
jgi:MFS family permease